MKYLKIITILATCNICIYASGTSRPIHAVAAPATQQEQAGHTITWSTPTGTTTTTVTLGSPVVLPTTVPTAPNDCSDKVFVGWSETNIGTIPQAEAPTYIDAKTIPAGDATYYAVFASKVTHTPTKFSVGNVGNYAIVAYVGSIPYALPANPIVERGKITAKPIIVSESEGIKYIASSDATGFVWTIAQATSGYTLFDGTKYIYHSNGGVSGTNLTYGAGMSNEGTTYTWNFTQDGDYITMAGMSGAKTNTRGILFNGTAFGGYLLSNTAGYYKTMILPIENITYSDYVTDCISCIDPATPLTLDITTADNLNQDGQDNITINLDKEGSIVVTLRISGGNGSAVTYAISPTAGADINDNNITFTQAGTYTITANQAYSTQDGTTFCGGKDTKTITISSPKYPLMLCDRGSLTETGKYEAGEMIPKPSSPTDVCTDYIHYTFDGWATTAVADSSTTYTPVSFPYAMPAGGATLYAVYRHAEEHSDKPFVLTTDIPRAGDSVIIAAQSTTGDWYALQAAKGNTATPLAVTDNIATPATQAFLLASANNNTLMLKTADNNYVHINSTNLNIAGSTISASFTLTADNGMFYLTRSDEQRWMSVTPSANGVSFGSTAVAVTAGNFYIFRKEQPAAFFTATPVCGRISTTTWQDDGIHITTDIDVSGADLYAENQGQTTIVRDIATGRNTDGTYTIPIPEINTKPCSHLQLTLKKDDYILAQCTQRVPIIVSVNTTTADAACFRKGLTVDSCKQCDIIVHEGVLLEHTSDSLTQFNSMDIYAGGQLRIGNNHLTLNELRFHATNDNVSYILLNNSGDADASISVRHVVHIKHIDGHYWYPFSLPYRCRIADICQVGGQPLGTFGTDWGIKFYDGQRRQSDGNSTTPAGEVSQYWTMMDANATLEAYQGYIIGLFGSDEDEMKSVCFTPASTSNYTESADAKTTPIRNWGDNLTSEPRHHGWNFIGSPYISLFGSTEDGDGPNSTHSLRMDYANAEGETKGTDQVLVSIPDPGDANTYTQAPAAATAIKPFMAYFVQAFDPADGASHTLDLTYSKANRSLPEAMPRRAPAEDSLQNIYIELDISNGTSRDNAGIQVGPAYSADYEIGFDLIKMYAAASKPQLFTRDAANNKMAYLAIPDEHAHHIPLGLYAPSAGDYTLSVNSASQLAAAGAVYLLHQNHMVANLLQSDYSIHAPARGLVPDYSLDIRRVPDTTTNAEPANATAPHVVTLHRTLMIDNLPADAAVQVYDILGHLILSADATSAVMSVPVNAPGVYTVCITTDKSRFITKVIIR